MNKKIFKNGNVVIKEGDINTTYFLVDTGGFEVTKTLPDATIKKLAQIGPNDIFGELDLIDHRPRAATITANQDSSVTELFKDRKMEAIVRDNPRALLAIVKVLANSLRNIIKNAQGIGY